MQTDPALATLSLAIVMLEARGETVTSQSLTELLAKARSTPPASRFRTIVARLVYRTDPPLPVWASMAVAALTMASCFTFFILAHWVWWKTGLRFMLIRGLDQ